MSASPSQIVLEAEKIIRKRFADNLSLQSVADEVHVTPVWLSKLFKKEKRMTFLEYLTDMRIVKAKEMLGDVRFKIYQISYQVGYKDPVHFTKLFKKQSGLTPKEFRKQRGIVDD
jgi:two-component system response regulator YesN